MWFVGQIGKSSKGNPLWSYKQTLTLIFVHGWDQHICGKYQVCTQQQSHWQLKITRKKKYDFFPAMWQCWRTIKITIVGGDGWSRKNMSRVTLWVCRPTSVTSAMTRRPPPRPWWLTCCRSSSTVLPPPASSSSSTPLSSLSSCDVVWRFYHILLEAHNVREAIKTKDWYFLGIFSKPVDPPQYI